MNLVMTQDYLKYKEEIIEYLTTKKGFIFIPHTEYANFKYAPGTILIRHPDRSKYEIIGLIKYTTGYVRYLGILTNSEYYKITSRDWKDLHDMSSPYKISLNDMLKEL